MMRSFAVSVFVVAVTLATASLLWKLLPLLGTVALALLVAATAETVIQGWQSRGLSRSLSVLLTYTGGSVILALILLAVVPSLTAELTTLYREALPLYSAFRESWRGQEGLWHLLSVGMPEPEAVSAFFLPRWPQLFEGLTLFGESAVTLLLVGVLAVYWSIQRPWLTFGVYRLSPARHRSYLRRTLSEAECALGLHFVAEALASLIAMTLVFCVAYAQGLPYPVVVSVAVALLRLIPVAGFPITVVLAVVAGHGVDTQAAILTPLGVVASERLANVLVNQMVGHRHINPFLTVVMVVALAKILGWPGLLVAPAAASVLEICLDRFKRRPFPQIQVTSLAAKIVALEGEVCAATDRRDLLPLIQRLRRLEAAATATPEAPRRHRIEQA